MKQELYAGPGIYLVEPLEEKTTLTITSENKSRIIKGKVIDIGSQLESAYGGILKPVENLETGDTIYFLSYEGQYDQRTINNKLYYFVNFPDLKGIEFKKQI